MKKSFVLVVVLFCVSIFSGFSPYESHKSNAKVKRVGLIAKALSGKEDALASALAVLKEKKSVKAFYKNEISNMSFFSRKLNGTTWFMVYFDYEGEAYLKAAQSFESAGDFMLGVNGLIESNQQAQVNGCKWLQMEWICYIRCSPCDRDTVRRDAMITTIKPAKEQEYRNLHQSVWPGVIDRLARSNFRHFSIFLFNEGDTIYEIFYQEYVGDDADKDGDLIKSDPVVQRWWKCTDLCQQPLPGEKDIWAPMKSVP